MRLSNKGRYGLQAVFDLAYHNAGRAAQIKEICERQGIPARFLEQVFRDLKKAGIVRSKRGPKGGYELARTAGELAVGDVVRAIDGPISLLGDDFRARGSSHEVLRDVLGNLSRRLESCFDELTVADLCARAEGLGVAKGPPARYVYAI
jgi:Rrf2 family transcriptional regulator, iron-sulfur cluster assembly transcription factor